MPDTAHDDRLAEAFTRFRSQAQYEIQPPGTDAVRHSVGRRRAVRVACAAVAVAIAIVGAGVVVTATVDSQDRSPADVYPTLSATELEDLVTRATIAVAGDARAPNTIGAAMADTQTITSGFGGGSSPLRLPRGDYDLTALCLGRGTVTVAWDAPGPVSGNARAVCDGDTVRVRFTTRLEGLIRIRLKPDAEAAGRAGIAVSITDPLLVEVRNLARDGLGGVRFSGSGKLNNPLQDTDLTGFAAGTYVLRFACLGPGFVTATLTVGTKSHSTRHSCREGAGPGTVTVTTTGHSTEASVALEPDQQTRQEKLALYAYNVGTG